MATRTALKSLTLTAFRGSTTTFKLDFEKNTKLTLIYGENGTGKTTICDAFEFLSRGKIGSLENRGMGSGLTKFWPTAGKSPSILSVDLETSTTKCSGKIVGRRVSVTPDSAKPRIELLRRQHILELIQARPGDRYEAIKRFIDIEAFERSEQTLRQLGKTLETDKEYALAAEQENLGALQGFYEAAGKLAGLNAVTWAEQKLAEPAIGLDADIAALEELRTAFNTLKNYPKKLNTCQDAVATAETELAAADQALSEALLTATEGAGETLPVLEAGRDYLHAHPQSTACPLCASEENIAGLAAEIDAQLQALSRLGAANVNKNAQQAALGKAETALAQAQADCEQAVSTFTTAQTSHQWKANVLFPTAAPPADPAALPAWLTANEAIAAAWAGVEAGWRDESKFQTQLESAMERYDRNAALVLELNALIPKVDDALTQCVEERQKFTDNIITEIAQEVSNLYEKVHPGEGLDKIALQLDPARRASLNLQADFEGHDAPPQAYFSQSHLDTLGLCVFVALALRDRAEETVLLLDDVLGSVDEPHVERVIGMIYEISTKFQHTIVTTHYRLWREKYRWGLLKPDQKCQFVELTAWSLGQGLALSGSTPEIVRLKTLLSDPNPDVQSICGKAGVILEALLDFLTLKYGCAVPRRQGAAYTLGDLLPAVKGKLKEALRVEIVEHIEGGEPNINSVELKPILDNLLLIAQTRNVMGAHFNALAFHLHSTDGIKFAKFVEQLADALICPDHGWPNKNKSGSYWSNGGDTRRLHPLKKPS